jgi:RimJ/RimL family protein N-acetyltransferase
MNSPAEPRTLSEQLRVLRLRGQLAEARELIRGQPAYAASAALKRLALEHEDFWWMPIEGRRVVLRRRGPDDAAFVRTCWADGEFMRKFNRLARPLPADDGELRAILARERAGLFGEAKALHWTIHTADGPVGFVSATDYAPGHRRCEFLIGVLRQPASRVPVEAAHLAVQFLAEKAGVERLTAYFYAENRYAAKVAEKFGFRPEGVLRGYILDADGARSDLLVSGLLTAEAQKAARRRLLRG